MFAARHAVLVGVVLGLTAGIVVWWLRRFELEHAFAQMGDFLEKRDEFNQWLRENGRD